MSTWCVTCKMYSRNVQGTFFMLGFPVTPNLLSEIWLASCNPETFNSRKTLESVDAQPLIIGDKVFSAELKVNNNSFRLFDEFSATVIDEAA